MNWRIVVAIIVAFIVGVAGGAFGERERLKRDGDDKPATSQNAADWFGNRKAAACPALKRWNGAIGQIAYATQGGDKASWSTTRATLVKQTATISAAYEALLPHANPAGKAELRMLIAYEDRSTAALKRASSYTAYAAARKRLGSPQLTRDIGSMVRAANQCPKT